MKFLLLIILLTSLTLKAQQENRYTEKDIAAQGKFIKATQKKLIGKLDEAIIIYNEILENNPNSAVALFDLSRIYFRKEIKDEAISYGEKAIKKDPGNTWYKESLAEITMRFEEYAQASKLFNQLLIQEKNKQSHYLGAIEAYRKLEDNLSTYGVFQKMESQFGANSYSIQQMTGILLDLGKNNEALNKASELLDLYPNDPGFIMLNAELHADFGSSSKAMSLFTELLKIDPKNSAALVYLARNNNEKDELSKIELIASNPAIDINTKVKSLIPYAKIINSADPKKERLIAIGDIVVKLHPDESKAYTILADLHVNSGNLIEAESNYIKAVELDKSIFTVWQQLLFIQNELGKFDALSQSSFQAMDFYPNHAAPYVFNGISHAEMGNFAEAKEMQQEALLIGTKDPFIKSQLKLLTGKILAQENGEDIKELTDSDIISRGLKMDDDRILIRLKNGNFLVRIQKGS